MKVVRKTVSLALAIALVSIGLTAQAQRQVYRGTTVSVRQLLRRIETRSNTFRASLDASLDRSRYDGTRAEDNINLFVSDFNDAVQRLSDDFNRRLSTRAEVQDVLTRAARVDEFMRRNQIGGRAQGDWASLRVDLNTLASTYGITNWRWDAAVNTYPNGGYNQGNYGQGGYNQGGYNQGGYAATRLTGTFRLDTSRSDDPRNAADRAVRTLPYRDRQRVLDALTSRLESPDTLAIERRGRTVTIASSRSPQFTFEADGRESVEQLPSGRTVRARATLAGDQLNVSTTGNVGNDFNVTFNPIDNGQRLVVTRRVSTSELAQPVSVTSVYERTSDVAQWDIYTGQQGGYSANNNYPSSNTSVTSSDFIVPNNTQLVAVLNNDLTTANTRENDRFTMTVRQPSQYDGATIEGHITGINRSGRITGRSEMTLNFDTIRMRDGSTYRFAGFVENVRTNSGGTVSVDNEGSVRDNNRTTTTEQRAAIGTAVGAIIGAIAGGGKGAAIGAIVGAGAGAGSVYAQGRDDLELRSGTEITVRSTGPR